MKRINRKVVKSFVQKNIKTFHDDRLKILSETKLSDLLKKKNPYLFRAKNLITAQEFVNSLLDAQLSASEEKIFGDFLEELAIFVAQKTLNAEKSSAHGIDFEYTKEETRFLVSVKSGLNWGNSSQWKALEGDFKTARRILTQSRRVKHLETVLGICYGKARTTVRRGIIKQVTGQNFWYMISGDERLYTEIVEPLGYKAKQLNDSFNEKKAQLSNKFTEQFIREYCDKNGLILWEKVVKFNSGNITPEDREDLV